MIVFTEQQIASTSLMDSDMVFVGYGIVAPERGWNDYAGVDVRGKTVVMLVNDPGYATQDDALFNGNAMTWYGRWPYKYGEAARQGAAGAFIIHETGAAAYGWNVVYSSWSRPQIGLTAANRNLDRCAVDGWLSQESARALFAGAGLDYEAQLAAAAKPGFRAVPLGDIKASITLQNKVDSAYSNNVIGYLPGSARPEETILYTAHWDHLGTNTKLEGDNIFNGALDNASGVAGLISLARMFSSLPEAPERSVVFLAVTAEESGLLGSKWYSEHPLFPLEKTVADINMDVLSTSGPMRDVVVVGYGYSELEDYLKTAVDRQDGRYITPEPHPERGFYYRSDHFSFASKGVPALFAESGEDSFEHGREWGAAQRREYIAQRYHSADDEYDPDWDLSGAALDILLNFDVGLQLAMDDRWPNWYPGNEFRPVRDTSAAARQD
jgi:Zn-dependent M28 family amino/carboxypeptidase